MEWPDEQSVQINGWCMNIHGSQVDKDSIYARYMSTVSAEMLNDRPGHVSGALTFCPIGCTIYPDAGSYILVNNFVNE